MKNCLYCNKSLSKRAVKYCDNKCQGEQRYLDNVEHWKNGNKHNKNTIKRFLSEKYGYKCACCGISEWNNKRIVLELEHINGDSNDNSEANVCLMCPNCHSQTDTYKGKNKGNGRHFRRERYKQGKSY